MSGWRRYRKLVDQLFDALRLVGGLLGRSFFEVCGHRPRQHHHALLRGHVDIARLQHGVFIKLCVDFGNNGIVVRRAIDEVAGAEQQRPNQNDRGKP